LVISGSQRADGAVGVLTVRVPEKMDPHKSLYDVDLNEHSILLMDWTLRSANDKFAHHYHAGGDNKADTILINGKGRFGRSLSSEEEDLDVPMPLEEFVVKPVRNSLLVMLFSIQIKHLNNYVSSHNGTLVTSFRTRMKRALILRLPRMSVISLNLLEGVLTLSKFKKAV